MTYEITLFDDRGQQYQVQRFESGAGITILVPDWRKVSEIRVFPLLPDPVVRTTGDSAWD